MVEEYLCTYRYAYNFKATWDRRGLSDQGKNSQPSEVIYKL